MAQNPLVEQAKQGNVSAIASLMNRLLKSQGMLANVERNDDRLEVLIESDLRSLDDEMRIPKRQILVGMLKKWFLTIEVQTISKIVVSWQQTGSDEPAWTEEIYLAEQDEPKEASLSNNGGTTEPTKKLTIPPLPVFPPKSMLERNDPRDRSNSKNDTSSASPDLDEMFGAIASPEPLPDIGLESSNNVPLESIRSSQDRELLFFSDIPLIADDSDLSSVASPVASPVANSDINNSPLDQLDPIAPPHKSLWQSLLKTPVFSIQLAQYVVVCVVIIISLRGIHTALGGGKAAKAASNSSQLIMR
ncbi:hypothetical protein [Pseudanabaena sp. 'Roaring Creek']|uniref:hypothetical protein n=1 Tax=Pseudanabaena sp. 'Roaring Creek' TaxID=1681830 RepID=UPI0006D7BD30|nr:hypothetical protein [Pseudanabaena sp. 'Roaring Creek']